MIAARMAGAFARRAAPTGVAAQCLSSSKSVPMRHTVFALQVRNESSEKDYKYLQGSSGLYSHLEDADHIFEEEGFLDAADGGWGTPKPVICFHGLDCPSDAFSGEPLLDPERLDEIEIECGGHWYRKIQGQKDALKGMINLRRTDCGPRGVHWRWYRDRRIAIKKAKRTI